MLTSKKNIVYHIYLYNFNLTLRLNFGIIYYAFDCGMRREAPFCTAVKKALDIITFRGSPVNV